jgi:hypothetical protein
MMATIVYEYETFPFTFDDGNTSSSRNVRTNSWLWRESKLLVIVTLINDEVISFCDYTIASVGPKH